MLYTLPVKQNEIKDIVSLLRDVCKHSFSVVFRRAQDMLWRWHLRFP